MAFVRITLISTIDYELNENDYPEDQRTPAQMLASDILKIDNDPSIMWDRPEDIYSNVSGRILEEDVPICEDYPEGCLKCDLCSKDTKTTH